MITMGSLKRKAIDKIINAEGGYVNDPKDSGGETNYGITIEVARRNGYHEAMEDMPRYVAYHIYVNRYWDSLSADSIALLSEKIAYEVVDTGANMGVHRAAKFLQRSINVLTSGVSLKVDGRIGMRTTDALGRYLHRRNEDGMLKALNCLQGAYYIKLAERREKDERFIYGWLNNRVEL